MEHKDAVTKDIPTATKFEIQHSVKISVLGKGMVGKTSLTYRFINYDAPEDHDPTIEDMYTSMVEINGKSITVNILDTAGQDDYQGLIDTWIDYGDGFLLVFALNDRDSFLELDKKKKKIDMIKKKKTPIILIGNKSDLIDRKITRSEAEAKAKSWEAVYFETFAKKDDCSLPFKKCVEQILENTLKPKITEDVKDGCCSIF